jgi:hypothetical protein
VVRRRVPDGQQELVQLCRNNRCEGIFHLHLIHKGVEKLQVQTGPHLIDKQAEKVFL